MSILKQWKNRAQQKLEFQFALMASKSQNLLARANFPVAHV